jgi:hypothetical protein
MKMIMYIGAALMIGAGIYGFVDYKKKNQSKEFQSLYRQEQKKEVQEPVTADVTQATIAAPAVTEKKEAGVVNKETVVRKHVEKKKHKKLNSKQFSRAALEEEVILVEEPEKKASQ